MHCSLSVRMKRSATPLHSSSDLDMLRGTVTVRRTWTRGRLGPTKTGHVRTASILHPVCENTAAWHPGATPETRSLLTRLRARRVQSIDPEGFVFGGVAPLHPGAVNRRLEGVLRAALVRYRPSERARRSIWCSPALLDFPGTEVG